MPLFQLAFTFSNSTTENLRCEISSKLTIKASKQHQWRCSDIFIFKLCWFPSLLQCFYCRFEQDYACLVVSTRDIKHSYLYLRLGTKHLMKSLYWEFQSQSFSYFCSCFREWQRHWYFNAKLNKYYQIL